MHVVREPVVDHALGVLHGSELESAGGGGGERVFESILQRDTYGTEIDVLAIYRNVLAIYRKSMQRGRYGVF